MVEKRFLILSFRLLVLCGQANPRMASALPPGDSDVADLAFVRKNVFIIPILTPSLLLFFSCRSFINNRNSGLWVGAPHPSLRSDHGKKSSSRAMAANALFKVNQQNMKIIIDACNGNLELQLLVLGYVQEHRERGKNLHDCMKDKAEKRKAKPCPAAGLADADDEAEIIIPEEATLPKNYKKYAGWNVRSLEELFQYCEPGTFSIAKRQLDSLQNARQVLEFGFGIKAGLSEGKTDAITNIEKGGIIRKKDCFDALRCLYLALGRRLRNLVIVEGNILWADQGIYKVERLQGSDEAPRTTVHNRFQDRRVEIPEDLVRGMTMKELAVQQNFSIDCAYVLLPSGDSLFLESLFPRIQQVRALRRRLSDDLGVTGDEEYGGGALPPPAKKHRPSDVKHAPKAAADASTPRVPSPPEAAVASTAGGVGVAATPAHPPLEASGDEGSDDETLGRDDGDE